MHTIRRKQPGDKAMADPRISYVVLDGNGREVGTLAKEPTFQRKGIKQGGGWSVWILEEHAALSDDAGGELWVPDFRSAKEIVARWSADPTAFRPPDPAAEFDMDALFQG
ncbi:hypothetical protein WV31_10145 [Magnetospirillum sp. ME-1]|uniref:hypothetical protein n=1 Tax=Magnetospirillum sp. ME-1 TaxID=1639348 RepID=UPI000A17A012|nr:hypothetical protein [Magnetospirillum sp. ME-1]ARJ65987.1 hypothetical protein WV31_10145 [Magnetospirillum sp. ME-1]